MQISEQEQQMIECIHEQRPGDQFALTIEWLDGAWNITLAAGQNDAQRTARGTGVSFDAAWENMAPIGL